jgi:mono/diheme cytochrome c family protein
MSARRIKLPPMGPLPRWVAPALIIMAALSFIPLALIARARVTNSSRTRIQIIPDMDSQPKFKTQSPNPLFADGRAMRPEVEGTVARGRADLDPHFYRGLVMIPVTPGGRGGDCATMTWAETFPMPVTSELVKRGQERYNIYCAPCHGLSGGGDGMVNLRADRLQEGTWTPPAVLSSDVVLGRPVGHLYNTITNGIRNMPAYGSQIPEGDRWAIVAYVRALQRSQHGSIQDVPPDLRGTLR